MNETIALEHLSRRLGFPVLGAEPVGARLIKVVAWVDGRLMRALIADPDSALGWAFLSNADATWRAAS